MDTGDIEFGARADVLMEVVLYGAIGLMGLFAVLMLARLWGQRMQKASPGTGGLDLDVLRRGLDLGQVSREEYEAVRRSVAGDGPRARAAGASAAGPQAPIEPGESSGGGGQRSPPDGQEQQRA